MAKLQPDGPEETVIRGPFGEEGAAGEGREPLAEIPSVHSVGVSAHTTFSPRCLDIMAELERQLREQGHGSVVKPYRPSDLVEIMAELVAPRLAGGKKPDLGRVLRSIAEAKAKAKPTRSRRKSKG